MFCRSDPVLVVVVQVKLLSEIVLKFSLEAAAFVMDGSGSHRESPWITGRGAYGRMAKADARSRDLERVSARLELVSV
jgi:hypothetical protein